MIDVRIDPASDVAPYEQVRSRIASGIGSGEFPVGFRLPPVRRLADDLALAANTVARAYRELELAGLIETRGRHGSFVAGEASGARAQAIEAAREYARRTAALGFTAQESLAIVRREVEAPQG